MNRPSEDIPGLVAQLQTLPIAGESLVQLAAHAMNSGELVQRGLLTFREPCFPAELEEFLKALNRQLELSTFLVNQPD